MTRRKLFAMLAGLPVVGRLAGEPKAPQWFSDMPGLEEVMAGPVTHYVGFDTGRSDVNAVARCRFHDTLAEAVQHTVLGRGDRILIAPGHREVISRPLDFPTPPRLILFASGYLRKA